MRADEIKCGATYVCERIRIRRVITIGERITGLTEVRYESLRPHQKSQGYLQWSPLEWFANTAISKIEFIN